jgi:hypothetical protein
MKKRERQPRAKDLTGQVFGRLTVIKRSERKCKGRRAIWVCLCECGNYTETRTDGLKSGNSQSCGCLRRERIIESVTRHGDGKKQQSKLYVTWANMLSRCYCATATGYKHYGGRGIYVCNEWRTDFIPFKEWALSVGYDYNKPASKQQIERIDNDGPYAPWNCKFADSFEQARNKRPRKMLRVIAYNEASGLIKMFDSAPDAAKYTGLHRTTIYQYCKDQATKQGMVWMYA